MLPFPIAGPVPLWRTAFCWIALLPLLAALIPREESPLPLRAGALLGFLSGFVWYLGNCYWIYQTMYLYGAIPKPVSAGILVLFCLYLGAYHALFGVILAALPHLSFAGKRIGRAGVYLLAPFVWVAVEFARARITGLPWDLLGITQVDNPLLTRLAPITGAYGLSFVIVAVNSLWLLPVSVRERRHTRTALTLAGVSAIIAGLALTNRLLPPLHQASSATAVLVQENLSVGAAATGPQLSKSDMLADFARLSLFPAPATTCYGIPELASTPCVDSPGPAVGEAEVHPSAHPTLIVWPESPAPFREADTEFRDAISRLARAAPSAVIVGNVAVTPDPASPHGIRLQNSAAFIDATGRFVGRYDKIHLVPFGEYVPFKSLLFFAGSLLAEVGEFTPGRQRSVFSTAGHGFGTFICYESIFGDEVRQFSRAGADVLVNISDDGWYGDTSAPWEHLNMVRMRAIENHRWVLRATNSGVTAVIDPYGRVVKSAPRHIRTSLPVAFDYEHVLTVYVRYGDWFAWMCSLVTALAFAGALLRRARPQGYPQA